MDTWTVVESLLADEKRKATKASKEKDQLSQKENSVGIILFSRQKLITDENASVDENMGDSVNDMWMNPMNILAKKEIMKIQRMKKFMAFNFYYYS
jgi:hypothetical protein